MNRSFSVVARLILFVMLFQLIVSDYGYIYAENAAAEEAPRDQVELIVKYKNPSMMEEVKRSLQQEVELDQLHSVSQHRRFNMEVLEIGSEDNMTEVLTELRQDPNVAFAQPNYELTMLALPEDERFPEQWGLRNQGQSIAQQQGVAGVDIRAVQAWNTTQGNPSVVIGVLDTGIDISHPDLAAHIYVNPGEIPGNGIDDDGNGYIDDVNGWDFYNKDHTVFDATALDKHGTHVAGIIAADANAQGISGVAPNVTLLPLKFMSGQSGYTSDALAAIEYAKQAGVKIINASFGSTSANPALEEAIRRSGILFVSRAGNNGADSAKSPVYPAAYRLPNMLSVAAIDNTGKLLDRSNYGSNVDVAAPGASILSTLPEEGYGYLSGTSMASAYVAGVAGLTLSTFPDMDAAQLAQRLRSAAAAMPELAGKVRSDGIIRANLAVQALEGTASPEEEPIAPAPTEQDEMVVTLAAEIDPLLQEQIHYGEEGVSVTTGNYSHSVTDLTMPSPGFKINVSRTYNSKDDRAASSLGRGWTFSFEGSLKRMPTNSSIMIAKLPNGSSQLFVVNSNNTYTANDSHSKLVKEADNSHTLTTTDQYTYGFNAAGYLSWMKDPVGNQVTIEVDSAGVVKKITDAVKRSYTVSYNNTYIKEITDQQGRKVQYQYDSANRLVKVIAPSGRISAQYVYDSSGYLTEMKDGDGNTVEAIVYNHSSGLNQHKATRYTDRLGNTQTFAYATNRTTTIQDQNGRKIVKKYDDALYVTESQDPEGKWTKVEYYKDASGFNKYGEEKSITDRLGNKTEYVRDANGNIIKIIYADSSFSEYGYDSQNHLIWERDELGKTTYYVYPAGSNLLQKTVQPLNGTDAYTVDSEKVAITSYAYYTAAEATRAFGIAVNGLMKSTTDPEGNVTTYKYDKYGNVTETIDAAGNRSVTQYNAIGWLTSQVTAEGYRTDYEYDMDGNLLRQTDHEGGVRRTVYDTLGRPVQVIEPNQYEADKEFMNNSGTGGAYQNTTAGTRTTYHPNGLRSTVTDALGNVTSYAYDLYGNLVQEIRPNLSEQVYEYDVMNRLIKTSFKPDAKSVPVLLSSYTYEALSGGQERTTETRYLNAADKAITVTTKDARGRVVSSESPNGSTVQTVYLANGQVKAVTDGRGNTTTFSYDGLNRLSEQWAPLDAGKYSYKRFEYDLNNRKVKEWAGIDPIKLFGRPSEDRLSSVTYVYNTMGQVEQQTSPIGGTTVFQYDGDGRMIRQEQQVSAKESYATSYVYNHNNQVISEIRYVQGSDLADYKAAGESLVKLETAYTYDANGNKTSATTPDGNQTTYTYDLLNRLLSTKTSGVNEQGQPTAETVSQTYDWAGQVLTATDALQNVTTYRYDERSLLLQKQNAAGGITAYAYDRAGRKIAEVSPNNYDASKPLSELVRTEYAYDTMNRVQAVTEIYEEKVVSGSGSWTTRWTEAVSKAYQYDENGNVTKELDAMGFAAGVGKTLQERIQSGYGTTIRYNAANLPVLMLDPASREQGLKHTKLFGYDGLGRKVRETDATGAVTQTYYDAAGNIVSTSIRKTGTSPEQVLRTLTYNSSGQLLTETDPYGHQTVNTYNAWGQIRKKTDSGSEAVAAYSLARQYDVMGRLVRETDNQGKVTHWSYDLDGRTTMVAVEDSKGKNRVTKRSAYDLNGNLRYETDGNGNVTEMQYNTLNQLVRKTVQVTDTTLGKRALSTTYAYDRNGNLLLETDPFGREQGYRYDSLNRLIEKIDGTGTVISKLEYNASNVQIRAWDALNRLTQYRYDRNNRQVMTIDPLGYRTTTAYHANGEIESTTDGKGNVTSYAYDYMKRLTEVTNALDERTTYTYDLNGNKLSQTDGNGHSTLFEYTAGNLLTRRIDHGGKLVQLTGVTYDPAKVESYTYYPKGQMKSKLDRNGHTTSYTYDVHGRLLDETVEGAALQQTPLAERRIAYTYDANGNQLTITDSTGTTSRSYDELNRTVTKTVPQLGTSVFHYDIVGDMPGGYTMEISQDVKGNQTNKMYDQAKRLMAVWSNDDEPTIYSYYADGSRQRVEYPGGVKEEYSYTANNQLSELKNWKGTTLLDTYSYTYDAAGNQTSKYEMVNGTNKGTFYTYDELNRLKQVQEPFLKDKVTSYRYDAAGNRTEEKTTQGSSVTIVTYSYNEQNRLQSTVSQTASETQTDRYRYDGNGNMIHKSREVTKALNLASPPVTTFGMFIEGQTNENARISDIVSGTESYTYNVWNQMVKSSSGSGTVNYAYNGEGYRTKKITGNQTTHYLYESDKVVLETDGSGKVLARNVYGLNLLVREMGTEKYAYLYNGHGDVTALVDASGTVQATYAYDAFGNLTESTGTVNNPIRYAGYQYDEESKLYYLNARYYDPKIARFLSEDTYRGSAMDPLSLNYYTYVHNEPLMYVDPSGHEKVQLRQLAEASGATISYNNKTKVATVTLVEGYSVDFKVDNNTVTLKDGRMIIDNELYDKKMSGSSANRVVSQNSSTVTQEKITAIVDTAVAGAKVAVVTNANRTSTVTSKTTGQLLATQTSTLRNSTVVFNKNTDVILNRLSVSDYPKFIHGSDYRDFTLAEKALIWEALTNNNSEGITNTEVQEFVDSKIFDSKSEAQLVIDLTTMRYNAFMINIDPNELFGIQYLMQGEKISQAEFLPVLKVGTKLPGVSARASSGGCNCFTAGTKVLTDEGEKNIEDIEVGDMVLSKDEDDPNGKTAYKEVTALFRNQRDDIIKLHVGEQIIETTDNHPFWVEGKGWVFADELHAGDKLRKADGSNLTIDKVEFLKLDGPVTVYNFTVADFHTYYVTDIGVWVHNTNCFTGGYIDFDEAPSHVKNTITTIRNTGEPPQGYVGGRPFNNRGNNGETKLPTGHNYKEYDVHPYQQGVNRGAERLVIADDGTVYYTTDHYRTYVKIK
ncbi:S8 family serine peptidase [Paenibacillus sp. SYP-B4298]|uniref:S8 family serine peptidase n=1 Tax=Paenibacillus sp. SYP-B4298 TaxID=2996034 RepID=UPI0022DD40C9|nr:S8 family serine peptidase [Paenibacillus sp. SYP-B4298]